MYAWESIQKTLDHIEEHLAEEIPMWQCMQHCRPYLRLQEEKIIQITERTKQLWKMHWILMSGFQIL